MFLWAFESDLCSEIPFDFVSVRNFFFSVSATLVSIMQTLRYLFLMMLRILPVIVCFTGILAALWYILKLNLRILSKKTVSVSKCKFLHFRKQASLNKGPW